MEVERRKFSNDRGEQINLLHEHEAQDIEEFDSETLRLGMSVMEIQEASHGPHLEDEVSLRGSMLSLSASSSSSSFTSASMS